ncbi:YitT family protein [Mesobacillus foraminis]|uniref:YitT family protein n=1 Tax=Mesobacillus foraminis TaxID=279826 RepID=UPI000EF483CD|nr:YitT family protein [Mesobacillus foraminis]
MKKTLIDIFLIGLGSFLFGLSVNIFVIPNHFGEGGVTGISIILYHLFGWAPSITSFILNGMLIVIGYKFLNKTTTIYTIIAVTCISLSLYLTESWSINSDEVILNSIFAGILTGIGLGLIFRAGGTSAGTTILAKVTNKYLGWNISYGLLFFDLIVVFSSYFIIGIEGLMFTLVMLYIGTKVTDFIIVGLDSKRAVTIISKSFNEIADEVNNKMERGVTVLTGYGYYTKTEKNILYIIINKQEFTQLRKIITAVDKNAFVSVHDVRDVFGEGFIE